MLNHLKWIATAVLALGIVPAGSGQAAKQPEGNDPVAQSLIEMERHWSESASPAEEIRVVQEIFAEDFLGTDTDGKLYTKSPCTHLLKPVSVKVFGVPHSCSGCVPFICFYSNLRYRSATRNQRRRAVRRIGHSLVGAKGSRLGSRQRFQWQP